MSKTRRHLAAATAALALAAALPAAAQSADHQAVAVAVNALTAAMLDPDKAKLEALTSPALSYGHSAGKLETQAEFIAALVARKTPFRSISLGDQTIQVNGNSAIVRHLLTGETTSNGTVTPVRIGVLQVWEKAAGAWKLYARQAYRI
jgi:hypothetical protein